MKEINIKVYTFFELPKTIQKALLKNLKTSELWFDENDKYFDWCKQGYSALEKDLHKLGFGNLDFDGLDSYQLTIPKNIEIFGGIKNLKKCLNHLYGNTSTYNELKRACAKNGNDTLKDFIDEFLTFGEYSSLATSLSKSFGVMYTFERDFLHEVRKLIKKAIAECKKKKKEILADNEYFIERFFQKEFFYVDGSIVSDSYVVNSYQTK